MNREEKNENKLLDMDSAIRKLEAEIEYQKKTDNSKVQYYDTAGEIEARETADRINLTAEERAEKMPDLGWERAVFADGSQKNMEIVTLDNGKQYVKATENQVIRGTDPTGWAIQVAEYINKELRNWNDFDIQTVEGDVLTLTKDTAYKAGFRNDVKNPDGTYRPMSDNEYRVKINAEVHINELSEISKKNKKSNVPDKKKHRFAKDGFSYRTAYFQDFDGEYYRITISVGHSGSVATVYNVGKIKKDTLPTGNIKSSLRGSKADSVSLDTRIAQNSSSVNTDYMQNTQNNVATQKFSTKKTTPIQAYWAEAVRENHNFRNILTLLDEMQSSGGKIQLDSRSIIRFLPYPSF